VSNRNNAAEAKVHFAESARMLDGYWNEQKLKKRNIALDRAHAHFLAGNLPQSILAFREGLDRYPWDAELQRGLVLARATVAYPVETEPAARVRHDPPRDLRNRISPFDLLIVSILASLVLTVGLARRFTTRDRWAWPLAAIGFLGILFVLGIWWRCDWEESHDRTNPTVVIVGDTVLRTGNGASYPARVEAVVPRGAEVRELTRRGGWVQVELAGGAVGWVPETVVLKSASD